MKNCVKVLSPFVLFVVLISSASRADDSTQSNNRLVVAALADALLDTSRAGMPDHFAKSLASFAQDPIHATTRDLGYVSGIFLQYQINNSAAFFNVAFPRLEKLSPPYLNELQPILASSRAMKKYGNLLNIKALIADCGWEFTSHVWCEDQLNDL